MRRLQEVRQDGSRRLTKTLDLPKIVCLCGSTRFYEEFQRVNYELTMLDNSIVLTVGFYPHAQEQVHGGGVGCTPKEKEALDELHLRKIDLADEVFVINKDEYVGESTMSEIAYALFIHKPIRWLEPPDGGTDDWAFRNRHALGKFVAKHSGLMPGEGAKEKTITLDDDVPGLGKAGDKVSLVDVMYLGAVKGIELGYHRGEVDDD